MPDTIKMSTFTTFAIQKYADWYDNPQLAKTFVRIGFGTLTEAEQSGDIYADPDQTQMHAETHLDPESQDYDANAAVAYFGQDSIVVSSEGPDTNVAYVRITAEFSAPGSGTDPYASIRGKTVREIGLYVDMSENPNTTNYQLMWLGKIDGVDIPNPEETARLVSINATIPVKFMVDTDIPAIISTDNGSITSRVTKLEAKTVGFTPVTLTLTDDPDPSDDPAWTVVDTYWEVQNSSQGLNMICQGSTGPDFPSSYAYFNLTQLGGSSPLSMSSPHFSLDLNMECPPMHMFMTGNTEVSPTSRSGAGNLTPFNASISLDQSNIWFRLRCFTNSVSGEEKWEGCVLIRVANIDTDPDEVRALGYIIVN